MKKKVFVLVLLILIPLFFLFSKRKGSKLEEDLIAVIYLPARVLAKTTSHPRGILSQRKERLLLELEMENERLRRLLKLKERFTHQSITALVIGREPTNWFNTILLNKGRGVGVEENFIVITPEGLVGRVNKVHRNSSQVLLITDQESEIGALIERSRVQGVIQGRKRDLIFKYLSLEADVREGDLLITSGLEGGLFPKGLVIGKIRKIEPPHPQDLFLEIIVTPEVNLSRLEEVLILPRGMTSP